MNATPVKKSSLGKIGHLLGVTAASLPSLINSPRAKRFRRGAFVLFLTCGFLFALDGPGLARSAADGPGTLPGHHIDGSVPDAWRLKEALGRHASGRGFHLFSHGRPGELLLDGRWRGADRVAAFVRRLPGFSGRATLNIYGCSFGAGERGRAAVRRLERVLGVPVAASDDVTGRNGDWELEVGRSASSVRAPGYTRSLQTGTCDLDDDACMLLGLIPSIVSASQPPAPPLHVRVDGNRILSPAGTPVFLKVATWENPFEGSVSGQTIIRFMDYMQMVNLNCILLKGNMWLIHDDRSQNKEAVTTMHWLIDEARQRGIYVILNLFDVWGRGRGTNQYNTDSTTHPINVWDWNHRHFAADYIKWVAETFRRHPMLLFELGNEMENRHENNWEVFAKIAEEHLLPQFYNICGNDWPIGVSQSRLWSLPVNVIFNHDPRRMPDVTDRPVVTNELAYDTDLWKDSTIRNPARTQEYLNAFALAEQKNHSGVAAATIIDINKPIDGAADNVLRALGDL